MPFEEKKYTNSKVDPTYFFNLGTHFSAFESEIDSIKAQFLKDKDFKKLQTLANKLSGLLEKLNLAKTNNLLISDLKEFTQQHDDYVDKRSLGQSGIDDSQMSLLRKNMSDSFDINEIEALCMDLGENHEELRGATLTSKVQSLIEFCKRRNLLIPLIKICEEERPSVLWLDGQNAYKCLKIEEWRHFKFRVIEQLNKELQDYSLLYLPNFQPPPSSQEIEDIYKCFHPREQFDALPATVQSIFQEAINCFACGQYTAAVVLTWHATRKTLDEYYHRVYAYLPGAIPLVDTSWSSYLKAIPDNDEIKYRIREVYQKRQEAPSYISSHEDAWLSYMRSAFNLCSALVKKWTDLKRRLSVEVYLENELKSDLDLDHDVFWALMLLEMGGGGIGRLKIVENQQLNGEIMRIETEIIRIDLSSQHGLEPKLQTIIQIGERFDINKKRYEQIVEKAKETSNLPLEDYINSSLELLPDDSKILQSINKIKLLINYSRQVHVVEYDDPAFDLGSLQTPEAYLGISNL